jgi:hypothetical protein
MRWYGLDCCGPVERPSEQSKEMLASSCEAEQLAASREELSSIKLPS